MATTTAAPALTRVSRRRPRRQIGGFPRPGPGSSGPPAAGGPLGGPGGGGAPGGGDPGGWGCSSSSDGRPVSGPDGGPVGRVGRSDGGSSDVTAVSPDSGTSGK
ncbi:hypothetical protein E3E14_20535 [Streptomyces sp. ICN441]|uniref:Uncharacterized protein n=1 Tax=Streptomyces tirandamycinicus TaxID=2174846 RepID=A0A2S1STU1_9ACTN|nr:hypothetical protein DDW44_14370 [Streptomyces tirandamycinicus]TFE47524.1 hypothetical protein E3E14_20535 [Streptomyces sp. ICN441]